MDKQPMRPNPTERQSQQQPALHQSDADDDDENVKQLNECSYLYLSLQVILSQIPLWEEINLDNLFFFFLKP